MITSKVLAAQGTTIGSLSLGEISGFADIARSGRHSVRPADPCLEPPADPVHLPNEDRPIAVEEAKLQRRAGADDSVEVLPLFMPSRD
jgi:hypothetical protein